MDVLITGAAGFLGARLMEHFLEHGHRPFGVDLVHPDDAWRLPSRYLDYRWGAMDKFPRDVEPAAIIHAGAVTDVAWSRRNPSYTLEANTIATASLLREVADRRLQTHFIYISTHSVYGPQPIQPTPENVALNPSTLYGAAKASSEMLVKGICQEEGIPYTIIRPALMCGVKERPGALVSTFIKRALSRSSQIRIDGNGLQTREIQPVENVVDALYAVAQNPRCFGYTFNAGSGNEVAIRDLAIKACYHANRELDTGLTWGPPRDGEEGRLALDSTLLQDFTGWTPKVHLDDIFPTMVDYYRNGGR